MDAIILDSIKTGGPKRVVKGKKLHHRKEREKNYSKIFFFDVNVTLRRNTIHFLNKASD